ncbi:MAG: hypothetical protein ACREKN_02815 [Longimicrobiaceae bacterium]
MTRPTRTPSLLLAATVALAGWGLALPAGAQSFADQGTFEVSVDGRPAGSEEFSIRRSGSGEQAETVATGRVSLRLPTGSVELSTSLRAAGARSNPVSYQVQVGGSSPRKIVGAVEEGRFSARISTPAGEQLKEYVVSGGALVLDDGVAHHYYFLAQRAADGRVPVIIPRSNRQVVATISSRGDETIRVGGTPVRARRLVVRTEGGSEAEVWVDGRNRVLRVDVPASGYSAVRASAP